MRVATREGIVRARSVRRIPVEGRWSVDNVNWVKWVPWNRYKDARDADGDLPEGVPAEEKRDSKTGDSKTVFVETRESAERILHPTGRRRETWVHERMRRLQQLVQRIGKATAYRGV